MTSRLGLYLSVCGWMLIAWLVLRGEAVLPDPVKAVLILTAIVLAIGIAIVGLDQVLAALENHRKRADVLRAPLHRYVRGRKSMSLVAFIVVGAVVGIVGAVSLWAYFRNTDPVSAVASGEAKEPTQAPSAPSPEPLPEPSVSARVISRIYTEGKLGNTTSTHEAVYQEVFADWNISYVADRDIPKLAVTITRLGQQDRVTAVPPTATVSGPLPRWMSGFVEPTKQPDWLSATITFTDLAKGETALIAVRRPLGAVIEISPTHFVRIEDIRSPLGAIHRPTIDATVEAERLTDKAKKIAGFQFGQRSGPPKALPLLVSAPKSTKAGEFQATTELHCETDDCEKFVMRNLEVRQHR